MKTIRRNATKKIAAIAAATMETRIYRIANDFHPLPMTTEGALGEFAKYDFARFTDNENGSYTIHITGDRWFKLFTAEYFRALGRAAYVKPNAIAAPAADAEMMTLMNGMPVGAGAAKMMLEWQAGWNAAARANEVAGRGDVPHDCAATGCTPVSCYQSYLGTNPEPRLEYSAWNEQVSDYEPF